MRHTQRRCLRAAEGQGAEPGGRSEKTERNALRRQRHHRSRILQRHEVGSRKTDRRQRMDILRPAAGIQWPLQPGPPGNRQSRQSTVAGKRKADGHISEYGKTAEQRHNGAYDEPYAVNGPERLYARNRRNAAGIRAARKRALRA